MVSRSGTLKITHVITGLRPHGAELALLRLVAATRDQCHHHVIVVSDSAELKGQFEDVGAVVTTIGLSRRSPNPLKLWRLGTALRDSAPHVVQTWLPAADFLGGVLGRMAVRVPVVWNLRLAEHRRWNWQTRVVVRLNGVLSRLIPSKIVAVGNKIARAHVEVGFDERRMVVIHNGFEAPSTRLDRPAARNALGIAQSAAVVCRLARFHPDKDYPSLLAAWKEVVASAPPCLLVMAGQGVTVDNPSLLSLVETSGVASSVIMLGEISDPSVLYDASDLTVSSSLEEGLPNVIGEAMIRGVPAVVTDVGDSAELVADTGRVVPAGEPTALAGALLELLALPDEARRSAGREAQQRIADRFSMQSMADAYVTLWQDVRGVPK